MKKHLPDLDRAWHAKTTTSQLEEENDTSRAFTSLIIHTCYKFEDHYDATHQNQGTNITSTEFNQLNG